MYSYHANYLINYYESFNGSKTIGVKGTTAFKEFLNVSFIQFVKCFPFGGEIDNEITIEFFVIVTLI